MSVQSSLCYLLRRCWPFLILSIFLCLLLLVTKHTYFEEGSEFIIIDKQYKHVSGQWQLSNSNRNSDLINAEHKILINSNYSTLPNQTVYEAKCRKFLSLASDLNNFFHLHHTGFPKIIHQSWKTSNLTPNFEKLSNSWKRCFPGWQWKLWTDEDNRELIKQHFPFFLERYDSYPADKKANIKRADAARYFYMLRYGGIYADLDVECIRPFDHLLTHNLVFGAMDDGHRNSRLGGWVQNNLLMSVPGHPFWRGMIKELLTKDINDRPQYSTGPIPFMDVLNEYVACFHDVYIYPPEFFNPFSWILHNGKHCKDFGRMTDTEMELCKHNFPKAYTVNYHAHSWE